MKRSTKLEIIGILFIHCWSTPFWLEGKMEVAVVFSRLWRIFSALLLVDAAPAGAFDWRNGRFFYFRGISRSNFARVLFPTTPEIFSMQPALRLWVVKKALFFLFHSLFFENFFPLILYNIIFFYKIFFLHNNFFQKKFIKRVFSLFFIFQFRL